MATESGNISVRRGIRVGRPHSGRDRPAPPEPADQTLASGLPRLGPAIQGRRTASAILGGGNLAGICGVMLTTLTLPSETWLLMRFTRDPRDHAASLRFYVGAAVLVRSAAHSTGQTSTKRLLVVVMCNKDGRATGKKCRLQPREDTHRVAAIECYP